MSQGSTVGNCHSQEVRSGLEYLAASELDYQGKDGAGHYDTNSVDIPNYQVGAGNEDGYSEVGGFDGGGFSMNLMKARYGGFAIGSLKYQNINQNLSNLNYNRSLNSNRVIDGFVSNINQNYNFAPDNFLKPNRISQKFIGQAEEIKDEIEETFRLISGLEFPDDIRIQICDRKEVKKFSGNPSVVGLSINRKEAGLISDIFILNDELDKVMLTIGHELGHVLSRSLIDKRDEEAKAFAYSFAWMKAIKENNIAGLGRNIVFDNPAQNGIHDLAFGFVWQKIREGKNALELYWQIVKKLISVPVTN
tara:strand:+ start:1115 stop:2032 length:918 start_codon:yes stop_codon:yes gene_type:complete